MQLRFAEQVGRRTLSGLDEVGRASSLLGESLFWTFCGYRWRQPVRASAVCAQMMQIGIAAVPITSLLAVAIGVMLAVQSLYSLGLFGAESFAHVGIALSLTREFAPLIVGILIAGRSGSALAARVSSMTINQEVDALRAMGLNPVRFLIAPALLAMIVMLPCLTTWANIVALGAAGLFVSASLDVSLAAYAANTMEVLQPDEMAQQRALARAAAAHDHHDLALPDREAHVEQDLSRAVMGVEMLHLDGRRGRRHFGDGGVRRGGLEAHVSASR